MGDDDDDDDDDADDDDEEDDDADISCSTHPLYVYIYIHIHTYRYTHMCILSCPVPSRPCLVLRSIISHRLVLSCVVCCLLGSQGLGFRVQGFRGLGV